MSTLKIQRIEVVAHAVGKIGVAFDEWQGKIVVARLLDGAGAKVGIRPGDGYVSFDGQAVKGMAALMSRLAKLDAGDSFVLNVIRDGKPITVRVVAD
jgi:serine protease Do